MVVENEGKGTMVEFIGQGPGARTRGEGKVCQFSLSFLSSSSNIHNYSFPKRVTIPLHSLSPLPLESHWQYGDALVYSHLHLLQNEALRNKLDELYTSLIFLKETQSLPIFVSKGPKSARMLAREQLSYFPRSQTSGVWKHD
jgi:hypothetical protein